MSSHDEEKTTKKKESSSSPSAAVAATPTKTTFPLVWVQVGKTQHPAWLLSSSLLDNNEEITDHAQPQSQNMVRVRWTITNTDAWVDCTTVCMELSPRRSSSRRSTTSILEASSSTSISSPTTMIDKSNSNMDRSDERISTTPNNNDDDSTTTTTTLRARKQNKERLSLSTINTMAPSLSWNDRNLNTTTNPNKQSHQTTDSGGAAAVVDNTGPLDHNQQVHSIEKKCRSSAAAVTTTCSSKKRRRITREAEKDEKLNNNQDNDDDSAHHHHHDNTNHKTNDEDENNNDDDDDDIPLLDLWTMAPSNNNNDNDVGDIDQDDDNDDDDDDDDVEVLLTIQPTPPAALSSSSLPLPPPQSLVERQSSLSLLSRRISRSPAPAVTSSTRDEPIEIDDDSDSDDASAKRKGSGDDTSNNNYKPLTGTTTTIPSTTTLSKTILPPRPSPPSPRNCKITPRCNVDDDGNDDDDRPTASLDPKCYHHHHHPVVATAVSTTTCIDHEMTCTTIRHIRPRMEEEDTSPPPASPEMQQPYTLQSSARPIMEKDSTSTQQPPPPTKQQYTLQSSAYLQNLAEICSTMMHDRRWRVGGAQQSPLFQWEHGDDLCVVTALSRCYVPRQSLLAPISMERSSCTCLLCHDYHTTENDDKDSKLHRSTSKVLLQPPQQRPCSCGRNAVIRVEPRTGQSSTSSSTALESSITIDTAGQQQSMHKSTFESSPTTDTPNTSHVVLQMTTRHDNPQPELVNTTLDNVGSDSSSSNDDFVRQLYLFCRLFYRKGPWFRIDDIYHKYYLAKAKTVVPTPSEVVTTTEEKDTSIDETARLDAAMETEEDDTSRGKEAKLEFFAVAPSAPFASNGKISSRMESNPTLDRTLHKMHLEEYLPRLFSDIDSLWKSGMIRFFTNEAECGKTVGTSVLTADERRIILTKLGAGKKRPRSKGEKPIQNENEIWKQMRQRKLSFEPQAPSDKGMNNILPVRRHMDDLVIQNLARLIVMACLSKEHTPMQSIHEYTAETVRAIQTLLKEGNYNFPTCHNGMCVRLQEAPTLALQRCVRLYLCAGSGPGDMRGNGTNGWRSVRDINVKTVPWNTVVPPPGQNTWHQVQYPGLSSRFGLTSALFLDAYKPLLVGDDDSAMAHEAEQVFRDWAEFRRWELCVEFRAHVDYLVELNEVIRSNSRRVARGKQPFHKKSAAVANGSVDLLSILDSSARDNLLQEFRLDASILAQVRTDIDLDVNEFDISSIPDECEKVLCTIVIVALHVLRHYVSSINVPRLAQSQRPWLRHMSWMACLAYMLFDIVPIMERRALYRLSINCLEFLVFGTLSLKTDDDCCDFFDRLEVTSSTSTPILLSRRARGKAIDRLIIDCGHLHRLRVGALDIAERRAGNKTFQQRTEHFCQLVINHMAVSSSIGFAMIRTLARRIRRPLSETLKGIACIEAIELGHRFSSAQEKEDLTAAAQKYTDWTPATDMTIANSLKNGESEPGMRCAYVGFEDDVNGMVNSSSLSVEELAMELYHSGRLPVGDSLTSHVGGWVGWHDEGGHVRALFRILCSATVLGMDFGCTYHHLCDQCTQDLATVHLSPYQLAPFDLHVGHEVLDSTRSIDIPAKSFYNRRATAISTFLHRLEKLSDQGLADLVYDSIAARLNYSRAKLLKDPFLDRDLGQVRTLSALAAGFGGKVLTAIFRSLFYDYRHYSGGLPDLHLFRAVAKSDSLSDNGTLIDFGSWIGEMFSAESQQALAAQHNANLISDRDDEFLGCSKVGDSGGQGSRSSRGRNQLLNKPTQHGALSVEDMPDRLRLVHNGCDVKVECMLVEVKSSNDRLDPRQEDWLNILDLHGNARVCKFQETSKAKTPAVAASSYE